MEDDDDFFTSMYGGDARDKPSKADTIDLSAPLTQAAAHKQLSGLKITGSHVKRIDLGSQVIDLPSAAYVKLLEDQIRALRTEVRECQTYIRRVTNAHNKLSAHVDRLKQELATKLTVR